VREAERRQIGAAQREVVAGRLQLQPASLDKLGYAWDQTDAHVQVYIPLPNVRREDVDCVFDSDGFTCRVVSEEGVPHQLTIRHRCSRDMAETQPRSV